MDIENRLKRLERANGLLLLLLAITAIAFWCTASSHVSAAQHPADIVANSIETRSLAVVNPTGKQGVKMAVGNDGMVSIGMTDVNGKLTVSLLSDPDGKPSICLSYRNVCRVVIGDVYRENQREFSVQLRNKAGNSVWMPATTNPIAAAGRENSGK
jgi:hypothetical protein